MKGVEVPAVCDINPAAAAQAHDSWSPDRARKDPELYTQRRRGLQAPDGPRRPRRGDHRHALGVAHADGRLRHEGRQVRGRRSALRHHARRVLGPGENARGHRRALHDAGELELPPRQPGRAEHDPQGPVRRDRPLPLRPFAQLHRIGTSTRQGNPRWSGKHLLQRNADQYPTHSLGPVLELDGHQLRRPLRLRWCRWPRARWASRTNSNGSTARTTRPAKLPYLQGDIVTTMVKTVKGNTIVIAMDMQLPRPYDNRWQIQGTRGLYNEQRDAVFIADVDGKPEQWEPFPPYQAKYDHSLWKNSSPETSTGARRHRRHRVAGVRPRGPRQDANAHRRVRFGGDERRSSRCRSNRSPPAARR